MKNWIGLCSFLLLLVMGSFVFVIAQRMHQAQTELRGLNRDIVQERDNLRVLQAEWTYLNNPDRLEKMAVTLFGLAPLDGKQYVALDAVPTMQAMDAIALASAAPVAPAPDPQAALVSDQAVDEALALAAAPAAPPAMPMAISASLTTTGGAE